MDLLTQAIVWAWNETNQDNKTTKITAIFPSHTSHKRQKWPVCLEHTVHITFPSLHIPTRHILLFTTCRSNKMCTRTPNKSYNAPPSNFVPPSTLWGSTSPLHKWYINSEDKNKNLPSSIECYLRHLSNIHLHVGALIWCSTTSNTAKQSVASANINNHFITLLNSAATYFSYFYFSSSWPASQPIWLPLCLPHE